MTWYFKNRCANCVFTQFSCKKEGRYAENVGFLTNLLFFFDFFIYLFCFPPRFVHNMYKTGARERSNGTEKHEQKCYMPSDGDTELGHCMHGQTYSVI